MAEARELRGATDAVPADASDVRRAAAARGRSGKGPTIYDVARAAGVAPSTVSRAFSRPGRVNAETSERVRRVAEEIGYRTTPVSRPAATQKTSLIGLVIADVTNPFYFDITRGLQDEAAEKDYTLILLDSRESDTKEREAIERTLPMVEGIVLASSRMSDTAIRVMAKQKPVVMVNRVVSDVPSVVPDNPRGIRRALELLGALGHERVTYLGGPEASWADGMRWRAMREAGMELSMVVRRVGPLAPTVSGGIAAVNAWEERPTSAVVAYNDLVAIGFIRALEVHGYRVPDDVSVVGFDNIFASDLVSPALTTVATPRRALGATAVRHLELGIRGQVKRNAPTVLPIKLMERRTTARKQGDLP